MEMNHTDQTKTRFDMYMPVHKGLRAFMTEVLITVGRIDPEDAVGVEETVEAVRNLLEICRGHLFAENQFVHTAMEARLPGSASSTASEHVTQEGVLEEIDGAILAVERSSGTERRIALLKLYRALALFVADNFQHMHVEETSNNEALWSCYTDDELQAIHRRILNSIEPRKMNAFLRWILPSVDHPVRFAMLAEMQKAMPEVVFEQLLSTIQPLLNEKDWKKLEAGLLPLSLVS